jgi:hypothetical protein
MRRNAFSSASNRALSIGQDLLVRMLGTVAATLCLILSLGQLQSQVS